MAPTFVGNVFSCFFLLAAGACSGSSSEPDAKPPCWPDTTNTEPTIEVALGVGAPVEPIQDEVSLPYVRGTQAGFHVELGVRATPLPSSEPGQSDEILLLFSMERENGDEIHFFSCPYRERFVERSAGFESIAPYAVIFAPGVGEAREAGRIRVTAEILDPQGNYGRAENWINIYPGFDLDDAGPDDAGFDDASVADAGPLGANAAL